MQNELADKIFWDKYWDGIKIPVIADTTIRWNRALLDVFKKHLPNDADIKIFEVGCAPGRWLAWFNQYLSYTVSGCDTAPIGYKLTLENLKHFRINGTIYNTEILSDELPENYFDIVYSIGFIEHYEDPTVIIEKHLKLLKKKGYLLLVIPNTAGMINKFLFKYYKMNTFLSHHNLKISSKNYLQTLGRNFNLDLIYLNYVGGFDPVFILGNYHMREDHYKKHSLYPLIKIEKLLEKSFALSKLFLNINSSLFSHMIVGIFQKK
jgi:SAM-dependent methyltransferase